MSVQWSLLVQPLDEAEPWHHEHADSVLRTASVGKCLLLSEVARRLREGTLDPTARVRYEPEEYVRDSGLWHALDQPDLTVVDACRLIGAVSDNLATNVLVREMGLESIAALAAEHELAPMQLLDRIRDDRDASKPGHADTLSRASARSVVRWLALVHEGVLDREVLDWLALGSDLSMVASAFGLDPLAHNETDRGIHLINKTGTDSSVRADVGLVTGPRRTVAYAVLANWTRGDDERDEALARMRAIGDDLRSRLNQG